MRLKISVMVLRTSDVAAGYILLIDVLAIPTLEGGLGRISCLQNSPEGSKQFVISTCDEKLLQLVRQKFRHIGDASNFYSFPQSVRTARRSRKFLPELKERGRAISCIPLEAGTLLGLPRPCGLRLCAQRGQQGPGAAALHRCEFREDVRNVVLAGGPGTGKTHVATAECLGN